MSDTAPFSDILFEDEFVARPPSPGAELPAKDRQKLAQMREGVVRLCEGADLVIYDTMFTPEDYQRIPHYGHSRPSDAVEICGEAGASRLALFHHAPERTDAEIDAILADTRAPPTAKAARKLDIVARVRGPGRGAGAALMQISGSGACAARSRRRGRRRCATAATPPACRAARQRGGLIILDCGTGARNLGISLMEGAFGKGARRGEHPAFARPLGSHPGLSVLRAAVSAGKPVPHLRRRRELVRCWKGSSRGRWRRSTSRCRR